MIIVNKRFQQQDVYPHVKCDVLTSQEIMRPIQDITCKDQYLPRYNTIYIDEPHFILTHASVGGLYEVLAKDGKQTFIHLGC